MRYLNVMEVEKQFNELTLRERVIIFAGLVICIISVSYFWQIEEAIVEQQNASRERQVIYKQQQKIENEIIAANLRLQKDPIQELNNKIAFSQQTLASLDKQLDQKLVKFIHAHKMPIALTQVLAESPGVKISSLISLPVEAFNSSQQDKQINNIFYKHTLQVELIGSYNAIYQYLLNIETLQEKFYWDSLDYQVQDYPLATVVLQIYTLSDQQDLVSG